MLIIVNILLWEIQKKDKHGILPQISYNLIIYEFLLVIKFGEKDRWMNINKIK